LPPHVRDRPSRGTTQESRHDARAALRPAHAKRQQFLPDRRRQGGLNAMRRWLASLSVTTRTALETALMLLAVAAAGVAANAFTRFDNLFYDSALRLQTRAAPPDIVIVAIDERSLAEIGSWPWSRRLHAQLVDRLAAAGTAAVAFDVLFVEQQGQDGAADDELARAIAAHGRVVLPVYAQVDTASGRLRPALPLPKLQQAAAALGHVHLELDDDAVARRNFLYLGPGAAHWPALALATLDVARNGRRPAAAYDDLATATWLRQGEMLLPYAGGSGHFHRISAAEILRRPEAAGSLRGSLVLIGATAAGLQRDFPTPMAALGPPLASVEIHANLLDALRRDLGILPLGAWWAMLLAAGSLLLAVLAFSRLGGRRALGVTALLLLVVAGVVLLLLHGSQVWLPPSPALLAVLLAYPLFTWRRTELTAQTLAAEQQRGQATLLAIGDAVLSTDRDGRIAFANPQAERLCGLHLDELAGRPVLDLLQVADPAEASRLAAALRACASGLAAPPAVQLTLRNPRGEQFDVRVSARPVRLPGGQLDGIVLALADLTESVALNRRIVYQATHDELTALPNRALLVDRLEHAIAAARRGGTQVALLFVDLDDFKRVNDGFGHAVGDALLRELAQRLTSGSRANDTVARWGGDEFLVLVDVPAADDADAAGRVARKLIERLSQPYLVLGNEVHVTASVGISLYPRDGDDPQLLVQNADRAMYGAKRLGGNRVQFFAEGINQRAHDRRTLEAGLRRAIADGEFELHYQPQVDLQRHTLFGAEVLLRWRHPESGLLLPDDFIPVAEEAGLIREIGDWVLREAARRAAAWRDAGVPPLTLSINVSARQLAGRELGQALQRILAETRLDPGALVLEITESAMVQDIDQVAAVLHEIRALGLQLALDDFGTGFSSLSLLKRMPLHQIKIDRSFVRGIAMDAGDTAIARGVIAMAKGMGIRVVAEGVETAAQMRFLAACGCDAAQGLYISAPVEEDRFLELLPTLQQSGMPPWEHPGGDSPVDGQPAPPDRH